MNKMLHKLTPAKKTTSSKTCSIHINNIETKYNLAHGAAFKDMLEARDQVL
jgi:hypothetical protein